MRGCFCITTLAFVCCMTPAAGAVVFYVRVGGSDDASGRTPATAFRTIGRAATLLNNTLKNGAKRGIDVTTAGAVDIEKNVASGNQSTGIAITAVAAGGVLLTVSDNQTIDNGSHGIAVDGAIGGTIRHNE